jgi:alpha-glucuronidase
MKKKYLSFFLFLLFFINTRAEDGYDLWLRYIKVSNPALLTQYKKQINAPAVAGNSQTIAIIREELSRALSGLTGNRYSVLSLPAASSALIVSVGSPAGIVTSEELARIGTDGYIIKSKPGKTLITANSDIGAFMAYFTYSG